MSKYVRFALESELAAAAMAQVQSQKDLAAARTRFGLGLAAWFLLIFAGSVYFFNQ